MTRISRPRARRAFTLLEMLISMVVVAILAVLIFQITSAASGTIRISNRSIDAAAQARLAFDRIGLDIASAVRDSQTDFEAANAAPGDHDLLQFLAAITAAGTTPGGNRGASLIAYQVNTHQDNAGRLCLLRAAKAIGWDVAGWRGLRANGLPVAFSDASFPASLQPLPSDFDVLAPGVLRMLLGFQLYPDDAPAELQDGSVVDHARGQVVYSAPVRTMVPAGGGPAVKSPDFSRVSAIVVGLAAIDLESLKLLDDEAAQALSEAFAGTPAAGQLPVAKWMADTKDLSSLPASVPLPARQAVRVYQRAFPLTTFPTGS